MEIFHPKIKVSNDNKRSTKGSRNISTYKRHSLTSQKLALSFRRNEGNPKRFFSQLTKNQNVSMQENKNLKKSLFVSWGDAKMNKEDQEAEVSTSTERTVTGITVTTCNGSKGN